MVRTTACEQRPKGTAKPSVAATMAESYALLVQVREVEGSLGVATPGRILVPSLEVLEVEGPLEAATQDRRFFREGSYWDLHSHPSELRQSSAASTQAGIAGLSCLAQGQRLEWKHRSGQVGPRGVQRSGRLTRGRLPVRSRSAC